MGGEPAEEADYDPRSGELIRDSRGNLITQEYLDEVSAEAEVGYDPEILRLSRVGRPSMSETGDSPQIRFRVPAGTRDEAESVAARQGKSLSQLAREALEAYLESQRSA